MNTPPSDGFPIRTRTTPSAWDELRRTFHSSMMMDTALTSLAENIDGCVWSVKGADETPAAYVDLSYPEVIDRLRARGLPPAVLDDLVDILRGTLAFDESFGEMVGIAGKAEAESDPVPRNLERLGIPLTFPVRLCNLTPGTFEFCQREKMELLADFLTFSRGASRQVIIGGEFRELLNAITHIDEETIARFLPFRIKTAGLYFIEGLALLVRSLPEDARQRLVKQPDSLPEELRARATLLADYFPGQILEMQAAVKAGTQLSRLVAPLDDLPIEPAVAALLRVYLTPKPAFATPAAAPVKRGFFQRLFGLGN